MKKFAKNSNLDIFEIRSSFDWKFYCRHFDTKYHIAQKIIPKIINENFLKSTSD